MRMTVFLSILPLSVLAATCETVLLPERLDVGDVNVDVVQPIDEADWIWSPREAPVHLFRRRFACVGETVTVHVSADNRYVLKLDGRRIARGPERGLVSRWTYRTLRLTLEPGDHVLEAVVDRVGEGHHVNDAGDTQGEVFGSPLAQLSWSKTGGFVLRAEGRLDAALTTGRAPWKVASFDNLRMAGERGGSFGIGGSNVIDGCSPWFADPPETVFAPAVVVRSRIARNAYGCVRKGWRLYPTALPQQLDEVKSPGRFRAVSSDIGKRYAYTAGDAQDAKLASWQPLLDGRSVTVPPQTAVNLLWDLGDYYCGYPEMETWGGKGARVEFGWSEALKGPAGKADRNVFVGKRIDCFNDVFLPDGGTNGFTTTWWRSGRWLRIMVKTADEPLVLTRLAIAEVRYPTPYTATFACSDPTVAPIVSIAERTLQMCSHEMSFDCPFYEQQMYPGDTRIQLLVHHVLSADDRLVRRDIELFDFSRRPDGRVAFNFPSADDQDGASYTFMWPMMLADYAMWRDNVAWLRQRLPGLAHTMEGFRNFENGEGLLVNLPGWNFQDWTTWAGRAPSGTDPHADGTNGFNSVFYVGMLRSAATVAAALAEPELASLYRRRAERTAETIRRTFWDEARGLPADDVAHTAFSEHCAAMSVLFDVFGREQTDRIVQGLVAGKDLTPCTVYFSHYLLDAFAKAGRTDVLLKRLDLWRGYVAKNLKTVQEMPDVYKNGRLEESRSDCHAWGAHPVYHLHANVLGLRPSSPFFGSVRIAPQPGGLSFIRAKTPSPKGDIVSDLSFGEGRAVGTVVLPPGLTGTFVWQGKTIPLVAGRNELSVEPKAQL